MTDKPRATVYEVDGKLVLDDPDAVGVIRAIAKHNCRALLDLTWERTQHFIRRVTELKRSATDTVIVIVNVDDEPYGRMLAEGLMPGHNWQAYRELGQLPVARGLAGREGIEDMLAIFDPEAAQKLHAATDLCIVVVDHGVAEIYPAKEIS